MSEPAAAPLSILSSMATRGLLADLAAGWDGSARLDAIGGVDAARRVRAGEALDVVVLADAVMRALASEGFVVPDSLAGLAVSGIAVAVRAEEAAPPLEHEAGLRDAILAGGRIGYSTGPSGEHVLRLLDRWNIAAAVRDRLVRAPPGMPVGRLLAEGAVDLAFQQRSELMGVAGIRIVGPLPAGIRSDTVFTAGIARTAQAPNAARSFIAAAASDAANGLKRQHGMAPVPRAG